MNQGAPEEPTPNPGETSGSERIFLIRCLVGILSAGIVISATDLAICRYRASNSCDPQTTAVAAAVAAAAGWIGGILTKSPQ
ncbi:hypothetical protein UFOVP431_76 [uncultured Caudovirales phage]|uniref:Uncharacterized protein n=1 Tax=uncultured Caudovirales phage TaxID=2100421 RepID=A0A6J5MLP4_9CAUD|nr:hypothetical protein UFOVP431_76 [uncultured Caudovirales phage]